MWLLNLLSYPRAVLVLLVGALYTIFWSIVVVTEAFLVHSRRFQDFVVKYIWSRPLLWVMGVRVDIRGYENGAREGKGFLILFNHTSLLDILVLYGYMPRPFRFGAKIELFKVPFFGKAMEACGVLPIDRGNRTQVMRVYESAIARINNGECFALAPEGTRQDSTELGKFKRGPFEFAINAQMDVVPVIIMGILNVLPKHSIWINIGKWRRKVILQITPPVSASVFATAEMVSPEALDKFQSQVRGQMASVFLDLKAELGH